MTDKDLYSALRDRIEELHLLIEDLIEYNLELTDKMAFLKLKSGCPCDISKQEQDNIKDKE